MTFCKLCKLRPFARVQVCTVRETKSKKDAAKQLSLVSRFLKRVRRSSSNYLWFIKREIEASCQRPTISAKLAPSERPAVYFCTIFHPLAPPRQRSIARNSNFNLDSIHEPQSPRCCATPLELQPEYVISPWSFRTLNLPSPLSIVASQSFATFSLSIEERV